MSEGFELTRDIITECVDARETSLGLSTTLYRGTKLTIIRQAHHWGIVKGLKYCTVKIGGNHFNVAALVLENSITPKRP